jgi:hypothetical protein
MVSNGQDGALEPIAVIGLAFQFPGGANTDDKLWKLMMERRCVSTEFPKDRFNIDLYHVPNETGASKVSSDECPIVLCRYVNQVPIADSYAQWAFPGKRHQGV